MRLGCDYLYVFVLTTLTQTCVGVNTETYITHSKPCHSPFSKVVYFNELSISSKEHVYLLRSFECLRPKELQLSNKSQVRKDMITLLFFLHDQRVTCFVTFHTYLWICWGVQSTERDMFVISSVMVTLIKKST